LLASVKNSPNVNETGLRRRRRATSTRTQNEVSFSAKHLILAEEGQMRVQQKQRDKNAAAIPRNIPELV
jgi:hypothetical protein